MADVVATAPIPRVSQKWADTKFWPRVEQPSPLSCWPWAAGRDELGYGRVGYAGKTWLTHSMAYHLHYPRKNMQGKCVCHACDNPSCCNPRHMFLGTRTDNNRDMTRKGRHGKGGGSLPGEKNPRALLTEALVRNIRADARSSRLTAAHYGVSASLIRAVRNGSRWGHLDGR